MSLVHRNIGDNGHIADHNAIADYLAGPPFVSASAYSDLAATTLNLGDSTTGWTATNESTMTYQTAPAATTASGTSLTATFANSDPTYSKPSNAGECLVAVLSLATDVVGLTPPASWQLAQTTGDGLTRIYYYPAAPSTWSATFSWTNAQAANLVLMELANVDTLDVTATTTGTSANPAAGTTGVPTGANGIAVAALRDARDEDMSAPTNSFVEKADAALGASARLGVFTRDFTSAAAQSTSVTTATSDAWSGCIAVFLRQPIHLDTNTGVTAITDYFGGNGSLYVDLTPVSVGSHPYVSFEVRYAELTLFANDYYSVMVASATGLTGTTSSVALVDLVVNPEQWYTVRVPVGSVSSVASVGLKASGASSSRKVRWYIRNIQLAQATGLDQAMASGTSVAVVVPATYTSAYAQKRMVVGSGRGYTDPRPNKQLAPGSTSVRNVREWGIDETGTDDVAPDITQIITEIPDHTTLVFPPNGLFRVDSAIEATSRRGLTILGQGCRMFQTQPTQVPGVPVWNLDTCYDSEIGGFKIFGYTYVSSNGSTMTTVAGTPSDSGTSKLLTSQNDEVRFPLKSAGITAHYGRDYQGRNRFDIVLWDVNQVTNDCVVSVKKPDGTLLEATTYTLTGTPTTKTVYYTTTDIFQNLMVTVKKATATANTIHIDSFGEYGKQTYDADRAIGHGVLVSGSNLYVHDLFIEGVPGDFVCSNDGRGVYVERVVGHVCGRQGMSFNQGQNIEVRNSLVVGATRHSLDIEPETAAKYVRGVRIDSFTSIDPSIGHWSSVWNRVHRVNLSNLVFYNSETDIDFWNDGFTDGTVSDCHWITEPAAAHPVEQIRGLRMSFRNIHTMGGARFLAATANDENGVSRTTGYNSADTWRAAYPDVPGTLTQDDTTTSRFNNVYTLGEF